VLGLGDPVELYGEREKFSRLSADDCGDGKQGEDGESAQSVHRIFVEIFLPQIPRMDADAFLCHSEPSEESHVFLMTNRDSSLRSE
jgi:hypothetical protein